MLFERANYNCGVVVVVECRRADYSNSLLARGAISIRAINCWSYTTQLVRVACRCAGQQWRVEAHWTPEGRGPPGPLEPAGSRQWTTGRAVGLSRGWFILRADN